MSLSEEEQQILKAMEQTLRKQDRRFVDSVNSTNLTFPRKGVCWALLAFIGGFALMLVAFGWSMLVGILGFGVMLCSSLAFVKHFCRRGLAKQHVGDARDTSDT